jgi:four helix bundle protein
MKFATKVATLVLTLTQNQVSKEYSRQLIRSSASIGANIEEAGGTLTKKDFLSKLSIARREARESKYWLNLIKNVGLVKDPELLDILIKESTELLLILSSIINKTRDKI